MYNNQLQHHGIKGMHWGVRRFQNEDGTLTAQGRRRYQKGEKMDENDSSDSKTTRKVKHDYNTMSDSQFLRKYKASKETYRKRVNKHGDPLNTKKQRLLTRQEDKFYKQVDKVQGLNRQINKAREFMDDARVKGDSRSANALSESIRKCSEMKLNSVSKADSYTNGRNKASKLAKELSSEYTVAYNPITNRYSLKSKAD